MPILFLVLYCITDTFLHVIYPHLETLNLCVFVIPKVKGRNPSNGYSVLGIIWKGDFRPLLLQDNILVVPVGSQLIM